MSTQKEDISKYLWQIMSDSIKLEGDEELLELLGKMEDATQLKDALTQACLIVERAARENAPTGTGELKRSIASRIDDNGGTLEGVVYTPLEYAPYVEYGTGLFAEKGGRTDVPWNYKDDKGEWHRTSGQKPQPYMRPALNDNREQVLDKLKEGLKVD